MSSVKVAVRVRPFNQREIQHDSQCCIKMNGSSTTIEPPQLAHQRIANKDYASKSFNFDYSYWSHTDPKDANFATQERVFLDIGQEMLNHAFDGYNVCIFAYGQTGSGKSFTMMGRHGGIGGNADENAEDAQHGGGEGIIPRLCNDLFRRIEETRAQDSSIEFSVEVSYIEIYCERVRDLLSPGKAGKENLAVRYNQHVGPYVEDLSKLTVDSFSDVKELIDIGNKARTVASTNMNETSSRSHAVFTIMFAQKKRDSASGLTCEHLSKINLVDLAGSERADSTGATGARLKEGANINRSLTTLGNVITALAEQALLAADIQNSAASNTLTRNIKPPPPKKVVFVPYRDSVLTWLLKESLGGNSKTAMIAALSPADINYEETLSTLRFANRAKQIVCKAVINEDPTQRQIRELMKEVAQLRAIVEAEGLLNRLGGGGAGGISAANAAAALQQKSPSRAGGLHASTQVSSPMVAGDIIISAALTAAASTNSSGTGIVVNGNNKAAVGGAGVAKNAAVEQLLEFEKLLGDIQTSREEKRQRTTMVINEHNQMLQDMGVALNKDGMQLGLFSPRNTPHLVNLNEDEFMSECLLYYIKEGITRVGCQEHQDIQLHGSHIMPTHCLFYNENADVSIEPAGSDANCYVNGQKINERVMLRTGSRIIIGQHHVFRFLNPSQARLGRIAGGGTTSSGTTSAAETPAGGVAPPTVDWSFAQNELLTKQGIDLKADMEKRLVSMEEEHQKEKQQAARVFEEQKREYEARIELLQRQVDNQSLIMSQSMYSLADMAASPAAGGALRGEMTSVAGTTPFSGMSTAVTPAGGAVPPHTLMLMSLSPLTDTEIKLAMPYANQWRTYRFSSLRNALWSNSALLKEANSISVEMGRALRFQFELLRHTPYTPLPEEFQNFLFLPSPSMAPLVPSSTTFLAVRVYDVNNMGALTFWSLNRLRQRLQSMREAFQREVDASERRARRWQLNSLGGSSEPDIETELLAEDVTATIPPSIVTTARPVHQPLKQTATLTDSGRFSSNSTAAARAATEAGFFSSSGTDNSATGAAYFPLGRALVYISNLLYGEALTQKVPVIDIGGNICAQLTVCVELEASSGNNTNKGQQQQKQQQQQNNGIKLTFLAPGATQQQENALVVNYQQNSRIKNEPLLNKDYALQKHIQIEKQSKSQQQQQHHHQQLELKNQAQEKEVTIIVTLLQAHGVMLAGGTRRLSECFCQFHFLNQSNDAFMTEIVKLNEIDDSLPINFFHSQHIRVKLSEECLNYFTSYPIVFELYGRAAVPAVAAGTAADVYSPNSAGMLGSPEQRQSPNTEAESQFQSDTHIPQRYRWPLATTNKISRPMPITSATTTTSSSTEQQYASSNGGGRQPPTVIPQAQPQPSANDVASGGSNSDVYDKYDLLANFEIRELGSNGEYIAAVVDHSDGVPCGGTYILHQGMQRRIVVTIAHEKGAELGWTHVRELLIGRVRLVHDGNNDQQIQDNARTGNRRAMLMSQSSVTTIASGGGGINSAAGEPPICEGAVISLSLFPGQYLTKPDDERVFYRFEAVWDSTLHNSTSLNRLSAYGEKIVITITAYIAIKDCATPAVISKDLALVIYDRSSKATATNYRSTFRNLLFAKPDDQSRVIGIYELTLRTACEMHDAFGRAYHPHLIDDQHSQSVYVRGEENLRGWRPRGDSLLFEHRWRQEKFERLLRVEQAKHQLMVRALLSSPPEDPQAAVNLVKFKSDAEMNRALSQREQDLVKKYLTVMKWQLPTALATSASSSFAPLATPNRANATTAASGQQPQPLMPPRTFQQQRSHSSMMQQANYYDDNDTNNQNNNNNNSDLLSVSFYSLSSAFASSMDNLVAAAAGMSPTNNAGGVKSSSSSDSGEQKKEAGTVNGGQRVKNSSNNNKAETQSKNNHVKKSHRSSKFMVDVKEARANPMVTKRGWLNFLDTKSNGWARRWVLVRRPYALLYKTENDMVERALINLATVRLEYGRERDELLRIPNVICICTPHRGFLMQAESQHEVEEWLYAMNPLAVGQAMSTLARTRSTNDLLAVAGVAGGGEDSGNGIDNGFE